METRAGEDLSGNGMKCGQGSVNDGHECKTAPSEVQRIGDRDVLKSFVKYPLLNRSIYNEDGSKTESGFWLNIQMMYHILN